MKPRDTPSSPADANQAAAGDRTSAASARQRRQAAGVDIPAQVLEIVRDLAIELHPHKKDLSTVDLESELEKDLGLDSLSRAELFARIERSLGVTLSDHALSEALTPRDLVKALETAGAGPLGGEPKPSPVILTTQRHSPPKSVRTLVDSLKWHATVHGQSVHAVLTDGEDDRQDITYADLYLAARRVAARLFETGLEPGDRVAIMLPTGLEFFYSFMGILCAGGIPVPIYPPWRVSRLEEHFERNARILGNAEIRFLVTVKEAKTYSGWLRARVRTLRRILTYADLEGAEPLPEPPACLPGSLALLQYTSGSTGDPKGVTLSHANILANIDAMAEAMGARPEDVFVSWLPLYHDMGLIGAWLAALHHAVPFIVFSPLQFLARPERWLWTLHRYKATISVAPNFAYELCLTRIPPEALSGLDLSSVRLLVDGSEMVAPRTIRDFSARFAQFGLRPEAISPGYGLAECAVGLTLTPADEQPRIDCISKQRFKAAGRAAPPASEQDAALELVSCGVPLLGHELRIVDEAGLELPERREGRLQFRGPSATAGYFRNPAKTQELFSDGWLETGDLGYMAEGHLFVTGRTKDIIVRAGRNIHPAELEAAITALDEVETGGAVLFGAPDPERGTEKLVLMIETRMADADARASLEPKITDLTVELLDLPPDQIVFVSPFTIPRTESGKIKRLAAREAFLSGRPQSKGRGLRQQVLRVRARAASASIHSGIVRTGEWLYTRYWWLMVGFVGAILWPVIIVTPKLSWRWMLLHSTCRLALGLLGHRLTVMSEEPPPKDGAIFVVNHSSYFDHAVVCAVLRGPLSFVAKNDLEPRLFEGTFLKRLDTLFVERFIAEAGLADTDRAIEMAKSGKRLVFYPEGTYMRMPGLLTFRMGAFVTAAKAGVPVVPVTLGGTRAILRPYGPWYPRRVTVSAHISKAIHPRDDSFEAALELRDKARRAILAQCREPDLAAEKPIY